LRKERKSREQRRVPQEEGEKLGGLRIHNASVRWGEGGKTPSQEKCREL